MTDWTTSQPAPKNAAEYRAAIKEMLTEMGRLNEQMKADQALIDRLQAEGTMIRAETRALLAAMDAAAMGRRE